MPTHTAHSLLDLPKHQGMRLRLVEELQAKGIRDQAVLKAMMEVPRHFFLDQALAELAYQDKAMPIGEGQTISQPYTVAFQSELLALSPHMKVLEIGTGSGYQACILDKMGARVFSVETIKPLHRASLTLLKYLNCRAKLLVGDGSQGLPTYAPFDRILVTAASPVVPETLKSQVRIGGLLVIPVGDLSEQIMLKLTRISETEWRQEAYPGFRFVPLTGEHGWTV
jgi:protein-L-isoaspartate(D-aspartate) O-methyltransferase